MVQSLFKGIDTIESISSRIIKRETVDECEYASTLLTMQLTMLALQEATFFAPNLQDVLSMVKYNSVGICEILKSKEKTKEVKQAALANDSNSSSKP